MRSLFSRFGVFLLSWGACSFAALAQTPPVADMGVHQVATLYLRAFVNKDAGAVRALNDYMRPVIHDEYIDEVPFLRKPTMADLLVWKEQEAAALPPETQVWFREEIPQRAQGELDYIDGMYSALRQADCHVRQIDDVPRPTVKRDPADAFKPPRRFDTGPKRWTKAVRVSYACSVPWPDNTTRNLRRKAQRSPSDLPVNLALAAAFKQQMEQASQRISVDGEGYLYWYPHRPVWNGNPPVFAEKVVNKVRYYASATD
ncbi:MAG: hypothetical protein Q4G70_09685 [Pseudomonadota bacterium]|nr:hypothetical protein [Pseudomonadota bacterium]